MALGDIFKKTIVIDEKGAINTQKSVASLLKTFGGFAGAALLVKGLVNEMKKNVQASIAQEQTFKKLETAVNLTGASYSKNEKALKELFATQQAYTQFGDTDSADMLIKLINFSGDYEASVKNLSLAQDIAATGLFDMASSARYVGLALAGNTEMLGRYIPELKAGSKEMAGITDKSEKVAKAMEILNARFGGTARKNVQTTAGAIQQLQNYMGDLREEIGDRLSPIVRDGAQQLKEFFARATETSLETTIRQLKELGASAEQLQRLQSLADVENYFSTYAENVQKVERQYKKLGVSYDRDVLAILGKGVEQVESATQGVNNQLKIYDELAPKTKEYNSSLANMANMTSANVDHWKEVVTVVDENKLTIENLDSAIGLLTEKSIEYGSQWKEATESGRENIGKQISLNAQQIKDLQELRNLLVKIKEDEERFNKATTETTDATKDQKKEVDKLYNSYVKVGGVISGLSDEIRAYLDSILSMELQAIGIAHDVTQEIIDIYRDLYDQKLAFAERDYDEELALLEQSTAYQKANADKRLQMEEDLQEAIRQEQEFTHILEMQNIRDENALRAQFTAGAQVAEGIATGDPSKILGGIGTWFTNLISTIGADISIGKEQEQFNKNNPDYIPQYADGGYIDRPQLAMIGESGNEGVLNAMATANLGGRSGIDALNSGQALGNTYNIYIDTMVGTKEYADYLGKIIKERTELGFV